MNISLICQHYHRMKFFLLLYLSLFYDSMHSGLYDNMEMPFFKKTLVLLFPSHSELINILILYPPMASTKNKYSVLLPTYNEKENLPVIVYLIFEMAEKQYTFGVFSTNSKTPLVIMILKQSLSMITAQMELLRYLFSLLYFTKAFRSQKSSKRCTLAKQ